MRRLLVGAVALSFTLWLGLGAVVSIIGPMGHSGSSAVHAGPSEDAAPAPSAESRRPLLSAGGFASALRRARAASPNGRLKLVRLAPARMDAQFARPGGGLDLVQIGADGRRQAVRTPAGGLGGTATLRLAAIDHAAPGRLVRSAAARIGRRPASVDYLVLVDAGTGGPRWSAYFPGGRAFIADAHGRHLRRIS